MDYPEEWNQLPRNERRKNIKQLRKQNQSKSNVVGKIRNAAVVVVILIVAIGGFMVLTKKSPEQIEFEQEVETVSLDGKVEEFPIEGRDHISAGTDVEYQTNPPTSGSHLGQAENWGVYSKEIDDKAAIHGLEHGGIWISYKDIDDQTKEVIETIGKENSQSVIVSPRDANDSKIVVASWGRMMKLEEVDKALIQKYIDSYINRSPENFAR